MKDVMLDLETLGTVPGCVILAIGAVAFDPKTNELGDEFYHVINRKSSESYGLFVDPETVKWWAAQSEQARKVLTESDSNGSLGLRPILASFNIWLEKFPDVRVWGNGADFDNPLLSVAYRKAGMKPGWGPWNGRCYRTVKNLAPHVKVERQGTHHDALDDAKHQARHIMEIVRGTTLTLA